jgi:hypothetical protein
MKCLHGPDVGDKGKVAQFLHLSGGRRDTDGVKPSRILARLGARRDDGLEIGGVQRQVEMQAGWLGRPVLPAYSVTACIDLVRQENPDGLAGPDRAGGTEASHQGEYEIADDHDPSGAVR